MALSLEQHCSPAIHRAAFALLQWVCERIGKPGDGSPQGLFP